MSLIDNSALDELGNFDSLDDFDIMNSKIIFVIITLFFLLLFFAVWGYSNDKARKSFGNNSILKRNEVLDIGIAGIIKELKKQEERDKNKKENQEEEKSNEEDDDDDQDQQMAKQSTLKEVPKAKKVQKMRSQKIIIGPNAAKLNPSVVDSRKRGVEFKKRMVGTGDAAFALHKRRKDIEESFSVKFVHAIKSSHNLISIFMLFSPEISRHVRFLLYFLRWIGIIFVTGVFFEQMRSESYSII
mmetsp:Transcript_12842/g.10980  ORF Transcript_12842/g.10980 Transcript_12842/m.10980 type:complete len:243 (-) Transcript_12842:674-1402(-)